MSCSSTIALVDALAVTRVHSGRREPGDIASSIIHNSGRKAVKDVDLAQRLGLTVQQLYQRLGRKLLLCSRISWFEVEPEKRLGPRSGRRPVLAFTLSGVIMVSASLGIEGALAAGMAIVPLLKTRRRSSKNRRRRPRRADDPLRDAEYQKVLARLKAALQRLAVSAGEDALFKLTANRQPLTAA